MSENLAVRLVPNDWDLRGKAHTLAERVWALAVRLVAKGNFRPNLVGGIDKGDVGPFARHLARAVEQERVSDVDRRALDALLVFLTTGAGTRGLTIGRGWRRWDQV